MLPARWLCAMATPHGTVKTTTGNRPGRKEPGVTSHSAATSRADSVLTTLDGLTSGKFVVTTHSGTRHIIDLDAKTAVRHGAPGREWGDRILVADPHAALGGSRPKVAAHYEPVTPDGEPFRFTTIRGATVGERMRLDNRSEWRMTSTVRSIDRAQYDTSNGDE